jgi:hypothetical protein
MAAQPAQRTSEDYALHTDRLAVPRDEWRPGAGSTERETMISSTQTRIIGTIGPQPPGVTDAGGYRVTPPAPRPQSDALARAKDAIRAAIIRMTPTHVIFDPEALDRAHELLLAAEPERRLNSACGSVSVGFPVRGEDYEDAPYDE